MVNGREIEKATWKTDVGTYEVIIPDDLIKVDTDSLIDLRRKVRYLIEDAQETSEILTKIIEARVK